MTDHIYSTMANFIRNLMCFMLTPIPAGADGIHWSPHDRRTVLTAAPGWTFTNAPTTVVQANGKVYRAVETVIKADNTAWGSSLIVFATVPLDDDGGNGPYIQYT